MRASLLAHDPQLGPVTMQTLMGIANAIEQEAVRRYTQLEQTMQQRGELDTAEAFRRMLEEEREHVEAVRRLAADGGVAVPDAAPFEWTLPPDLALSWEAIAGSSLLTPYRAFAIAVENEQRAFAFYSYLAAHACDRAVAQQAERLAAEELRHAARVRQWRREAYHRERPHDDAFANARAAQATAHIAESPERLREFLDQRHAAIVACHRHVAARLRELGDDSAASLLEGFVDAHGSRGTDAPDPVGDDERARIAQFDDPLHLLVAAQKPLEKLGESLDQILLVSRDEAFAIAEHAATDVVAWLARVSLAAERRARREPAT
ncbi:MAG TPA: ferritin family protein [Zeimonas sp.]